MGTSQYISLKDAALLSDRSAQTIRRLIKSNKIRYRKYKTPQGFTYLVEKTSLLNHFAKDDELNEAELVEEFDPVISTAPEEVPPAVVEVSSAPIQPPSTPPSPPSPPPKPKKAIPPGFDAVMSELIRQHRDDKKRLFELLETFQKRILTLEDQIRQLEAPKPAKKRRWFSFFQ